MLKVIHKLQANNARNVFDAFEDNNKNSSGAEIANVNFYAVRPEAPEFAEITQNNGHYAVQGYSRSPILVPVETLYTISY